ncbi:MAG: amino acid adenylation domain-containing protein, partial [Acidobacteria bacterium]|nr:amino acid adenylation domain-containing protein [Acidobacteriota bacterium]
SPRTLFRHQTVEALAAAVTAPAAPVPKLEDLPLAGIRQDRFEELVARYPNLEDLFPLSPLQQGLLFQSLYQADSPAYFVQLAVSLEGEVHGEALRAAWQEVLNRHAALRTAMVVDEDRPLQVVCRDLELPWTELVLEEGKPEGLERWLEADRHRGFDPSRPPMIRLALLGTGPGRKVMVLSSHHILLDGWSMPVLFHEVLELYRAQLEERKAELPPVRPYRDFIAWLEGVDDEADRAFWSRYLAGFRDTTPLPMADPSASVSGASESTLVALGPEVTARAEAFVRQHRLTLSLLCQTAWGLLLSRYGGTEDVVFGTTVAGRPAEMDGVEAMVGLFINTLPVRLRLEAGTTVLAHLRRLQDEQIEREPHEHFPLQEIRGLSELDGSAPLFETLMVYENFPVSASLASAESSLPFRATSVRTYDPTHYPLNLIAFKGEDLTFRLSWDGSRFDAAAVDRLGRHLARLFEGLVAGPEGSPFQVEMLSPSERQQLLHELNEAGVPPAPDKAETSPGLHDLFFERAREMPEAVALRFGEEEISYGELARRARRIAASLERAFPGRYLEEPIPPETRIAILQERRPDLVAGLLAILSLGGAYVPLDPAYPRERLAFMLRDAGASLVLATASALEASGLGEVCREIACPVVLTEEAADNGELSGLAAVDPRQLAYLIYTSGSTGTPKAVAIPHGAATALVRWAATVYSAEDLRGVLAATSICFDLSVYEIFLTLSRGGTLVLAENVLAAAQLPARGEITLINTVPSAIAELLRSGGLPEAVRIVNLAGEPLSAELSDELYAVKSVERVYDLYGPSEDTTYSTFVLRQPGGAATVGRPIHGTRAYVLDRRLGLVPRGVAGELVLAGQGLARGYLGRPRQTAERFVPDPFDLTGGGRLYRTGDLARHGEGGDLHLLGRMDHQVKLRGYRIEIGEIEAHLKSHETVEDAAVVVDRSGSHPRLVAFLVVDPASGGKEALEDLLRPWLGR